MPSRLLSQKINVSNSISHLSAMEEVVFIHLIVSCDDYGRFYAHPEIIKGMLFPLRNFKAEQIEDVLTKLEDEGMIIRYECEGTAYLELTAWMNYQSPRAKSSKYPGPSNEGSIIHHQEDENECKQVQETASNDEQSQRQEPKTAERFEKFWNAYPKKVGKKAAEKAFEKAKVSESLLQTMLSSIEKAKMSSQWQKDNGQYIPNPTTWLNQGRWMDELHPSQPTAPGGYTPNHYITDGQQDTNPFRK